MNTKQLSTLRHLVITAIFKMGKPTEFAMMIQRSEFD